LDISIGKYVSQIESNSVAFDHDFYFHPSAFSNAAKSGF